MQARLRQRLMEGIDLRHVYLTCADATVSQRSQRAELCPGVIDTSIVLIAQVKPFVSSSDSDDSLPWNVTPATKPLTLTPATAAPPPTKVSPQTKLPVLDPST